MNVIVKKIAGWCLDCGAVEESELEVVTYGLELILGTVIKYIFLLGIGCLFGRGLEIIIVLSLIAVFRTFAGGVHGRTSADCFGYMLLVCVLSVIFSGSTAATFRIGSGRFRRFRAGCPSIWDARCCGSPGTAG